MVVHEVHAPVLVDCGGRQDFAAQQRDPLAPFDLHAQLEAFESEKPTHALLADRRNVTGGDQRFLRRREMNSGFRSQIRLPILNIALPPSATGSDGSTNEPEEY